jgi:hypothetical protein
MDDVVLCHSLIDSVKFLYPSFFLSSLGVLNDYTALFKYLKNLYYKIRPGLMTQFKA